MSFPDDEDPIPSLDDDPLLDSVDDRAGRGGVVSEFVKKAAVAGLGALFMTEEGIRNLAGQLKLPKEALGFVVSQAERTKEEIARVVSEEIRRFLQSEKVQQEFRRLLADMTFEIKAEVSMVPKKKQKGSSEDAAADKPSEPKIAVTDLHTRRTRRGTKES